MPIEYEFANLAGSYNFGADVVGKAIDGVAEADWLRRPNESTNHLLFIVGHMTVTRGVALRLLGVPWADPWPGLFGRGAALVAAEKYPSVTDVVARWQEVARLLPEALGKAAPEALAGAGPQGIPSFDGKLSGVLTFLAFHDGYHVGQVAYLRKWLGYSQTVG